MSTSNDHLNARSSIAICRRRSPKNEPATPALRRNSPRRQSGRRTDGGQTLRGTIKFSFIYFWLGSHKNLSVAGRLEFGLVDEAIHQPSSILLFQDNVLKTRRPSSQLCNRRIGESIALFEGNTNFLGSVADCLSSAKQRKSGTGAIPIARSLNGIGAACA